MNDLFKFWLEWAIRSILFSRATIFESIRSIVSSFALAYCPSICQLSQLDLLLGQVCRMWGNDLQIESIRSIHPLLNLELSFGSKEAEVGNRSVN